MGSLGHLRPLCDAWCRHGFLSSFPVLDERRNPSSEVEHSPFLPHRGHFTEDTGSASIHKPEVSSILSAVPKAQWGGKRGSLDLERGGLPIPSEAWCVHTVGRGAGQPGDSLGALRGGEDTVPSVVLAGTDRGGIDGQCPVGLGCPVQRNTYVCPGGSQAFTTKSTLHS